MDGVGPSLGHVSGEVRVYPAGPAAASSGIISQMADSHILGEKGCAGCRRWADRDSSIEEVFGYLDRDLYKLGEELTAEFDGDLVLLALRGLNNVMSWMTVMSVEFDLKAEWYGETHDRFKDLVARAESTRRVAPVRVDASIQTEMMVSVDAAVGGSPRVLRMLASKPPASPGGPRRV